MITAIRWSLLEKLTAAEADDGGICGVNLKAILAEALTR